MAKTVADKLLLKPGATVWVTPESRLGLVGPLPEGVAAAAALAGASAAVVFADDAAAVRRLVDEHGAALRDVPLLNPDQIAAVFRLATMAFQRKRKTIGNGLSQGLGSPKAEIEAVLDRAGIDPTLRPQNLDVHAWLAIAEGLAE